MHNLKKSVFLLLSIIFLGIPCFAQDEKPRHLQSVEFLTGFGGGNLDKKGKYEQIPCLVDFNFNLAAARDGKDIKPQVFQFVLEPFISYVLQPLPNIEAGTNFLFKINIFPKSEKLMPYLKGGSGIIYISQHTREQATQLNFNEVGGFGLHYFFRKDRALTFECRFRHISNADIKDPNRGIDSTFVLCGVSYKF